jgi:signal transduction histidine kinase
MRTTVRTRLTLLFAGLFLATTIVVLLSAVFLVLHSFDRSVRGQERAAPCAAKERGAAPSAARQSPGSDPTGGPGTNASKVACVGQTEYANARLARARDALVQSQWQVTLGSIALMGTAAFVLCWWMSGRALRPVHQITDTARRLSLSNLDQRIGMRGPRDELKELADTFDAMLERLARAADDQRRFTANASHELRTPLAIQRAAIEIGLADTSPDNVVTIRTQLLRATERSQRLIDGLFALAQGERGLQTVGSVNLSTIVHHSVEQHDAPGIEMELDIHPVNVSGDEALLARLVDNLLQNAVRYNEPGGRVVVRLRPEHGLEVSNTGPAVDPERVADLFQPFLRLNPDRTDTSEGAGLGLSIVAAIAQAHGFAITATANPTGGLTVHMSLPPSSP